MQGQIRYLHEHGPDDVPELRKRMAGGFDNKVRAVCGSQGCNDGWMDELDHEAESIVAALMRGISVSLDADGQDLLTRWALKVSYMTEFLHPAERRLVPAHHRRLLMDGELPPNTYLWIADYRGHRAGQHRLRTFDIFDLVPGVEGDDANKVLAGKGYMLAFSLSQLAIRVLGYPDIASRPLKREEAAVPWETQLLPRVMHTVVLPPPKSLRDADWRNFTNRLPTRGWS